jgi:hypothetical protein
VGSNFATFSWENDQHGWEIYPVFNSSLDVEQLRSRHRISLVDLVHVRLGFEKRGFVDFGRYHACLRCNTQNRRFPCKAKTEGGTMIHDDFDAARSRRLTRVCQGNRNLEGHVRVDLLQSAFTDFSGAAEAFAASLSDEVHRNFAFQYLKYLQRIAQGRTPVKPEGLGLGPASRLIRAEIDRLFELSFFSTVRMAA